MEVLNYNTNLRFSPVIAAVLATSVALGYSGSAAGETPESSLLDGAWGSASGSENGLNQIPETIPLEDSAQVSSTISSHSLTESEISPVETKISIPVTLHKAIRKKTVAPTVEPIATVSSQDLIAQELPTDSVEPAPIEEPTPVEPPGDVVEPAPTQPSTPAPVEPPGGFSEPAPAPTQPSTPAPVEPPGGFSEPAPAPAQPSTPAPVEPPGGFSEPTPAPTQPSTPAPAQPPTSEQAPVQEPRVLVGEVVVTGAQEELTDLVYNTISTQPGRTTTRSRLQEDINAVYATGFFANVRVIPEDTPLGVRITFAVQPNPVLRQVNVETVPQTEAERVLPPEVVNEIFGDQYGEILNLQQLQDDIRELNEWYTENGYDLAQVVGAPAVAEDGTVTLVVAEGVIENIRVRFFDEEDEPTDGRTRDFIVTREIQLEPGDVFNRNTAQRDLQRVFGLGLFEDVRFSFSPGSDPREVVVNVDVVEGSTGSLAGGAGISSASGLFGTVSYQQRNLGGNNQTLGAEFQFGTRELLFDASFTDPWIAGDPYRTSYTINAFRRRSISLVFDGQDDDIRTDDGDDRPRVVRTGGGINFARPLPADPFAVPDWRLSAGFQYQRVAILNADGDISPRADEDDGGINLAFSDDGTDDLFLFQFGATRDRRNNPLQPTSGSFARIGLDQSVPIGSGSILLTRLRGSYSYYIPVSFLNFTEGPQALAFNVQAGTVLGDLPPYEAFVLGGTNSVRGYPEGEIGSGRSFVQATAEYRFPIFSVVGGALFLDYGTTLGTGDNVPGEPSEERGLPGSGFGYGLGVRVNSPLGPIRIDYAINDEGDNQLEFGIGEKF